MERLDIYLHKIGLFPSRDKAKEAVQSGIINIDGNICTKPSIKVDENNKIEVVGQTLKYVSRAGLKLEKAFNTWSINFNNKVVLDVGASTGGFTDFCIQNGASKVYAVDVGTNQLHESLLHNPKVVNMQKTDFRTMPKLPEVIDICVCDCSFISLTLLSQKFEQVLTTGKELIILIKPQFECGKEIAQKTKGVIKDPSLQENIKSKIINHFETLNFKLIGSCDSPILGTAGNKEFLAYFIKQS